jgi:hypothetical protein
MIGALDAARLLCQAMHLEPGDPLPGTCINPAVASAVARAEHQAGSVYVATHRLVDPPPLEAIAAAIGEPLFIPNTLGERALANARAVLAARVLDHGYAEYLFAGRAQGTPVNPATVNAAVRLLTDAITQTQREAALL